MRVFNCLEPTLNVKDHYFLEASAGTGKTFAIENLTVRLLLEGFNLDEILIVTFTRAATRDLKHRIRKNLQKYLSEEDALGLEEALLSFDKAQIFTIHGFCHRMLTEFAFEAGVGMGMTGPDEMTYLRLLENAALSFLRHELNSAEFSTNQLGLLLKHCGQDLEKLLRKLTPLLLHPGELASARSFEESKKAFDVNFVMESDKLREDLVTLSLMYKGICDLTGNIHKKWHREIEALCSGSFEGLLEDEKSILELLTEENKKKRIKEDLKLHYPELASQLFPIIKEAKDPRNTLLRLARACQKKVGEAFEKYEAASPDEILIKMKECLKNPLFYHKVKQKYQAAIIDEFQDTDPIQWDIFYRLFLEQDPIEAFYLVGDPKQSIYGFRNADLKTYLKAAKELGDEKRYILNTNYRSDPALIGCLNTLFLSGMGDLDYQTVEARPGAEDTQFQDGKKPVHFFIGSKEKKREKRFPNGVMEEELFLPFIADEIIRLKNEGFNFDEFAILVRDRYQAARVRQHLNLRGIPVLSKGTTHISNTKSYFLMKLLRNAVNAPHDISALKELLSHPFMGYDHHQLKEELIDERVKIHLLKDVLDAEGYAPFIHAFFEEFETYFSEAQDYSDFIQLVENLDLFEDLVHISVEDDARVRQRSVKGKEAVTLMTIHMSKGLEFGIVFALGLMNRTAIKQDFMRIKENGGDELIPFREDASYIAEQESEKLRQLYVALTRAKRRVYVPVAVDLSGDAPPLGTASPIELFLKSTDHLEEMGMSVTDLNTIHFEGSRYEEDDQVSLISPSSFAPVYDAKAVFSFTSLAKSTPSPFGQQIETKIKTVHTLPSGVQTGLLIHSLFEKIIEEGRHETLNFKELIQKRLTMTPYAEWEEVIVQLIEKAFTEPLKPAGFCLKDVPQSQMLTEVEFLLPVHFPQKGYLKGFADLFFEMEGRYYLLDWKTNYLGENESFYQKAHLEEAMKHGDYFFQANLYMEALKAYLALQETRPFEECFGGVFYLFVRGGTYHIPSLNPSQRIGIEVC